MYVFTLHFLIVPEPMHWVFLNLQDKEHLLYLDELSLKSQVL